MMPGGIGRSEKSRIVRRRLHGIPEAISAAVCAFPSVDQAVPGETVRYDVSVTDWQGRGVESEVSLALVDKAVLSLAEGLRVLSAGTLRNTCTDFHDYVQAVRAAGQEDIAIRELRRFAAATESEPVRERMAEFLSELGDAEGARSILDGTPLAATPSVEADEDQNTRWVQILLGPTVEA